MQTLTIPSVPGYIIKAITFTVASASTPDKSYTVSVNPLTGKPQSCDCPAYKPCWHMKFVASGAAGQKPRVRLQPKPAAPVVEMTAAMKRAADLYA